MRTIDSFRTLDLEEASERVYFCSTTSRCREKGCLVEHIQEKRNNRSSRKGHCHLKCLRNYVSRIAFFDVARNAFFIAFQHSCEDEEGAWDSTEVANTTSKPITNVRVEYRFTIRKTIGRRDFSETLTEVFNHSSLVFISLFFFRSWIYMQAGPDELIRGVQIKV